MAAMQPASPVAVPDLYDTDELYDSWLLYDSRSPAAMAGASGSGAQMRPA